MCVGAQLVVVVVKMRLSIAHNNNSSGFYVSCIFGWGVCAVELFAIKKGVYM